MQLLSLTTNHSVEKSTIKLPDIIVFSHLRWEFVKQRPQHIMERLAKKSRVLFVEEPIAFEESNYGTANLIEINDNLMVIQPRTEWDNFRDLKKVVETYSHLTSHNPIVWFYSAAFYPILQYLDYSLVVFDCMDELAAFKGAPKALLAMEKKLLSAADVVFTGGKSLYESKRVHNQNTHCFPSSVDKLHFQKAFARKTEIPADIARITKPIVGFYGVIDERMDLPLLAKVAKLNPTVSFVMIGPVVKISESDLPRANNIHYLGNKSYDVLPNYLKAFNIAMMPFALNESTRFISPTKTLEFMAAHKPIISTPIYDVRRDYSREVEIVHTAQEFSQAIAQYLHETVAQRKQRITLQKAVIERTSWNTTAARMQQLMVRALDTAQAADESMVSTSTLGALANLNPAAVSVGVAS